MDGFLSRNEISESGITQMIGNLEKNNDFEFPDQYSQRKDNRSFMEGNLSSQ